MWHGMRVPSFRKPAGMKYPKAYADTLDIQNADSAEKKHAMYLFNCAQRAHANYLENHPSAVIAMLIAGIQYPIASAVTGALWMACRLIYAVGYTRSDKTDATGRLWGTPHSFIQLGLYFMMAWTGYQMISQRR